MLRRFAVLLTGFLFCSHCFAAVGFRQITLNSSGSRPIEVAIWYPTQQTGVNETIGENAAFEGSTVLRNAVPVPGAHPLLLLSHGYGGSWRNLAWLAEEMVSQGYIVVAPNHPGTTSQNTDSNQARQLWLRPEDLRLAMREIIRNPTIAGEADRERIAAAGHSLGGWTVMELAGARFDTRKFSADCAKHIEYSSCRVADKLGIGNNASHAPLSADRSEKRIKAVILLDTGLARGFTSQSLATIDRPVFILAAGADSPELPAEAESGYLARALPPQWMRYSRVDGATHFSFMQVCKPQGEKLIEESAPGEGIICHDGDTMSRKELHRLLAEKISEFLNAALHYQPQPGEKPQVPFRSDAETHG